jgi:hypothetical protein
MATWHTGASLGRSPGKDRITHPKDDLLKTSHLGNLIDEYEG